MPAQTVNATYNDKDAGTSVSASVQYDFRENASAAIEAFGEEVVQSGFVKSAVILLQGSIRRSLQAGLSEEEIQSKVDSWIPGVTAPRTKRDPLEAAVNAYVGKSQEEQAAFIKQLQTAVKAAAQSSG